jgi:Flp pilus assembly protein TadG
MRKPNPDRKPCWRLTGKPGRRCARPRRCRRRGAILVWFALLLVLLLGMVGLVIDGGLLMATHRQAQNAADAAALAAAFELMYGKSNAEATATATTFVQTHNGLAGAPAPIVNIPPATGAYAGALGYVEVIASCPLQTFFIHLLPGISSQQTVRARAVAGFEAVAAGEGVAVLNPYVTGLTVGGTSTLRVFGLVVDNSEGKGVDEFGNPVGTGENYYAGRAGSNSPAYGTMFHIVGGVDWPENFRNIDEGDPTNVLHCAQLPVPDPLLYLPTPTTALGVDPTFRGEPQATNQNFQLGDADADYSPAPNYVTSDTSDPNYIDTSDPSDPYYAADPTNQKPTMVLHPGIYRSISVSDGKVRLLPGIYVLRPAPNTMSSLKITGGRLLAKGIMVYNTGHNYSPETGYPDNNDGDKKPPKWGGTDWDYAEFGSITINASMYLSPIDLDDNTVDYDQAHTPDRVFDGMLFYQRRRDTLGLDIQGDPSEGYFGGTLYCKWAHVKIAGQGTYDAQFVVGSMETTGGGVITVEYTGSKIGKAPQVFLVE